MRAVSVGTDLVPTAYSTGADAGAFPRASLPAADAVGLYGNAQNPQLSGDKLNRYDDDKDDGGPPIWPWLVGLLVVLLVAGGIAAYVLTRPSKVSVPDVVGLSLPIAQGKIDALNLNPEQISENSNTAPANTVISQVPIAGSKIKSGGTVTLTVSSGAGNVQVPTVVSLTRKQAIAALKIAGLTVARVIQQSASGINKGQAIGTSPDAGTSVARGSGVTLIVSSGTALPNVVGDLLPQAQQALTGFKVTTTLQVSTTATVGTVMNQSPPANTPVATGSTVNLTVAEAPKTAAVPDVVGYTQKGAASTLQNAGFSVVELPETVKNPSEVGDVVRQRPQPQTIHLKGSNVIIIIGVAPATRPTTTVTTPTKTTTTPTTTTPTTTTPTTTTSTTTTTTGQTTTTT
jgi:serine/threonine-protein kinase